jgi:PleD family two-component response regulator
MSTPVTRPTKILIVDDDPVVLEVTRERLARAGYDVHAREEALGTAQWIFENHPDYALLDINMPALPGTELALLLKRNALTQRTAIILYSSRTAASMAEMVRATGALGAIEKTSNGAMFMAQFQRLTAPRG